MATFLNKPDKFYQLIDVLFSEVAMEKLIEIDGRWIQIKSKVIQINGEEVITQGEIKILDLISFDEVKNQINSLNSIAKPVDLAVNKYRQANDLFEQREASF